MAVTVMKVIFVLGLSLFSLGKVKQQAFFKASYLTATNVLSLDKNKINNNFFMSDNPSSFTSIYVFVFI